MKKRLIVMLALLLSLSLSAQKKNLVVGQVGTVSGIDAKWADVLRSNILSGLSSSPRLVVVDGNTINGLSSNIAEATEQLKANGAEYLLTAQITSFIGKTETSKDGKVSYNTTLEYTTTVLNLSDGSTLCSLSEKHYGSSSDGYTEAYASAFGLIGSDMRSLVDKYFRIVGVIRTIAETHPKKGAKTLYISLGSDNGVAVGNIFEVFKEVDIAGETIAEKIGELKAKEIKSGTLTLCTVTKGGVNIQEAVDNQLTVTVVSRPAKILGGLGDFIDAL